MAPESPKNALVLILQCCCQADFATFRQSQASCLPISSLYTKLAQPQAVAYLHTDMRVVQVLSSTSVYFLKIQIMDIKMKQPLQFLHTWKSISGCCGVIMKTDNLMSKASATMHTRPLPHSPRPPGSHRASVSLCSNWIDCNFFWNILLKHNIR